MTLERYQVEAKTTSIYKDKVVYPVLGLINEYEEFVEKYNSNVRNKAETLKEIGDVFWYMAALNSDCALDLSKTCHSHSVVLPIDLKIQSDIYLLCKLAGRTKKWMRDNHGGVLSTDFVTIIITVTDTIYSTLLHVIKECGSTLEKVLAENIDKLKSRMERNVIHGDGDNR